MFKKINLNSILFIETICIFLTGIGIATFQWLYNRSLWLDEAMLANNIISRNFSELLQPLDNYTAAPPLYLYSVKFITLISGISEYAFRIFALVCFIISTFIYLIYLKKSKNGIVLTVFSFSLFVFNAFLIRYASELKQYMADVLFSTLFLLLLHQYKESNKSKRYLIFLLLTGCLGIFFSHAVIILIGTSTILFLHNFGLKKELKRIEIVVILVWIAIILMNYFLFFYNHPSKQFQIKYWIDANAFLPIWGSFSEVISFLLIKTKMVFFELFPFGLTLSWCLLFLFFLGLIKLLVDKKWYQIILYLSPIILHLALSALKMYPFEKRYLIYLIPFIILIISYGFQFLYNFLPINNYPLLITIIAIFIPLVLLKKTFENRFPIKIEEVKEVISYLKQNEKIGDNLYVYYSSKPAIDYYLKTNFFKTNIAVFYGNNCRDNIENYIKEFPKVKGNIWVLLSHIHKKEDDLIIEGLKLAGYYKTKVFSTKGAAIYYFTSPY